MRASQERSQECLPPKKRELPVAASSEEPARAAEEGQPAASSSSSTSSCGTESVAEWGRGAAQAAGLGVEQFGLLYKVSLPPPPAATFSPVVTVSPLPPAAFTLPSQLLPPHPGLAYSPLHFAQLPPPPAPLQFVGSPYSVPYAAVAQPGFLSGPLLPASAALAASHVPHFVPYAPLLAEGAASPPRAGHGRSKVASSAIPLRGHVGAPPLDVAQGQIPIYYQMSRVPAGYSAFETRAAGPNPDQALQEGQPDPKLTAANGGQRSILSSKERDAIDGHFSTGTQMPSQRSTPDTDLEVQRVVGAIASRDYSLCSSRQDSLSPLNLSHRNRLEQTGKLSRNPLETAAAAAPENHVLRPSTESPIEQLCPKQIPQGLAVSNGKLIPGSPQLGSQGGHPRENIDTPIQEGGLETECLPSQSHLPSHFMKGAIIQLATGELKRVEDLQTQDFVRSAEVSGGLKIDSSTVVDIQESPWQGFVTLHFVVGEHQNKVSIDVPPEHPFFVYGQGWSSCSPERTGRLFLLPCHRLQVGDVCISISLQSLNGRVAPLRSPQGASQERPGQEGLSLQDSQGQAGQKSPMQKEAAPPSLREPSLLESLSLHGWAGPSFQRSGETFRPSLLRPSFIPQEIKLSIEGRSNSGK